MIRMGMTTVLRTAGKFIWQVTVSTTKHDIASLAAVIAFYALFSLFPLILLIVYAGSVLLPNTHVENLLLQMIRPYFPALPAAKDFLRSNISQLAAVGAKVGLVSAATLTWSATSGFIAVQQAMDVIWEIPQQRSFVTRRVIAFVMLFGLLLLTLGSAIGISVYPVVRSVTLAHAGFLQWLKFIHGVSRILFPLSLFIGCVIFYRYLPSRATRFVYVIPGALVAAFALDTGRKMFVWYASHLVTYQIVYGTLAGVMLLVFWMYLASIVMLFGAEVAAALGAVSIHAAGRGGV